MDYQTVANVLELFIMFVLEKKDFKKSDTMDYYGVTDRTIQNYFNAINNSLFDRYMYLQIEYDYSKKCILSKI
ncbi:hypothetical protein RI065_10425 [Mycoplasmatota bacterium zrk1]